MVITAIWKKTGSQLRDWGESAAFLKKHLRLLLLWPLAALLIGVIGWSLLWVNLESLKHETEAHALGEAELLAKSHANHLFRALQVVDQMTLYVQYGWESSRGAIRLEKITHDSMFPDNAGMYVSIIDKHGNLVTTTVPQARTVNVAYEPYFIVQQDGPGKFFIGTAHIGNFSGTPVVPFSRRLSDANGHFNGIVLISVSPEFFMSSYDPLIFGDHGYLAILSSDKTVRLARIGKKIYLPDTEVPTMLTHPPIDKPSGQTVLPGNQWFTDGRTRYIGYQSVAGYEMVTMAGLDQQTVLAPYWADYRQAIHRGILATIALGVLTLVAMAVALRMAWRKDQLDDVRATYRSATESGSEGFFIATPIFNENGKVSDFRIVDCNERGASFLGYRRSEMLGRTVLSLYHGEVANRTMRMLCKAMKERHYEGETDLSTLGINGPDWIQLRISRLANNLAITMRDISDMKAHVAELERRGNEDALTHLPNRHWLNVFLPGAIASAAANHKSLALLFIDLDGFKSVNDTAGHETGDEILRNAALRLREATRPHDHVARVGGDEFLVVVEDMKSEGDATHIAERILAAFTPAFHSSKGMYTVGASIGISLFPKDGSDAATLLKNADIAMYSAKTAGKRSYRYFDESFSQALYQRHQKEVELRHALEHDQFVMYYQPRLDMRTGNTSSMEALVRWMHPTRGLVEPNDFIPLAEETGLINQLGAQVIDKVCAQLASWAEQRQELVPVSINVSARQFHETNVAAVLASCIKRYHVDPALIEIELTESSMIDDTDNVAQSLQSMQKMGVRLLVDDFGTGYSSLSQLQRLDFDVLKVDRAFTADLGKSGEGNVLFTAIITMAHSLGMRVVAEGVETLEQLKTLKTLRCDEVQGFLISRPLPASEIKPSSYRQMVPSLA